MTDIDMTAFTTVAQLIQARQNDMGTTDDQISAALGYAQTRVIATIKKGQMRVPLTKLLDLAGVLDVDGRDLVHLALRESDPGLLQVLEKVLGPIAMTKEEMNMISTSRTMAIGGPDEPAASSPHPGGEVARAAGAVTCGVDGDADEEDEDNPDKPWRFLDLINAYRRSSGKTDAEIARAMGFGEQNAVELILAGKVRVPAMLCSDFARALGGPRLKILGAMVDETIIESTTAMNAWWHVLTTTEEE